MKTKPNTIKNAKIFYRISPEEKMTWDNVKILDDNKTIYIRCLQDNTLKKSVKPTGARFWTFPSDRVFYNDTQKEIYDHVTEDVLTNLFDGNDAIIMAFGQTGTGKSLTIGGLHYSFNDRGILPRIIPDLFKLKNIRKCKNSDKISVQISFFEIFHRSINDLLKEYPNRSNDINDITRVKVKNENEAFMLLFTGEGRKDYFENSSYGSNRASSVFTFHVSFKNTELVPPNIKEFKLHVLDLAGADTVGNLPSIFKEPRDISNGNLAKTQLEQFLLLLSQNISRRQIKVRQRISPLVHYMGNSLNSNSVLRFIGHINIDDKALMVTISMLRFGLLVTEMKTAKCKMESNNNEVSLERIRCLQNEIQNLKNEKIYNCILSKQHCAAMNRDRYELIKRTVNEYVNDKISKLGLLNISDVNVALDVLKNLCKSNGSVPKASRDMIIEASNSYQSHDGEKRSKKYLKSSSSSLNKSLSKRQKERKKSSSLGKSSRSSSIEKVLPTKQESHYRTIKSSSRSSTISNIRKHSLAESKKKSMSNASVYSVDRRSKSRSTKPSHTFLPEIPPEYKEAWKSYVNDRNDEYTAFRLSYEEHEKEAKIIYTTYLIALKSVKEALADVEKKKREVLLARLTKEFQQTIVNHDNNTLKNAMEEVCAENLRYSEISLSKKQEDVLEQQATLITYINQCKNIKNELQQNFDEYCREKYSTTVENLEKSDTFMDIEKVLSYLEVEPERNDVLEVKAKECLPIDRFEYYKQLTAHEKRKIEIYKQKNKRWTMY